LRSNDISNLSIIYCDIYNSLCDFVTNFYQFYLSNIRRCTYLCDLAHGLGWKPTYGRLSTSKIWFDNGGSFDENKTLGKTIHGIERL